MTNQSTGEAEASRARDNLTRSEAERRAASLSEVRYTLRLDLQKGARSYRGELVAEFAATGDRSGLFIDFTGREIRSATVNGHPIGDADRDEFRIALPAAALADSNRLEIHYENDYDRSGSGFHHFVDPEDGREYLFSDFEPFKAHRLFPCFDQPDLKATYEITVTAPREWVVLSNAPMVGVDDAGDGRTMRAFARSRRFSTYLVAVIAGEYAVFTSSPAGEIPLRIFCRQTLVPFVEGDLEELFTLTRQGFAFFEDYFGVPYPFAKYDQVFVPEFNAGAMENVAAVTLGEYMVFRGQPTRSQRQGRAETVLHELAHMWFGNLVTMRWWDDLWLNESFATFAPYLALVRATSFADSWEAFASRVKSWAYRQDQLVTTHPVACPVHDTESTFLNFDGITYGKGAAVLKQLMAFIGEDAFRAGLQRYFRGHAWGNATQADFFGALQSECGRDLTAWSRAWVETSGVGALAVELTTEDGRIRSFEICQEAAAPPGDPILRPHRLDVALFRVGSDGRAAPDEVVSTLVEGERSPVPELVGCPAPALVHLDHGDLAYSRVFLDPVSLAFVKKKVETIDDPLTRIKLWGSLWQMVRDQRLGARDYGRLVAEKIPLEERAAIVEAATGNAGLAILRYVPPAARAKIRRPMFAAAWESVSRRRGNLQLIWFRASLGLAAEPEDLDKIERLLDGDEIIGGVEFDQPLRWTAIQRLVAFGRPGAEERLAAERERDPGDLGRKSAFAADAARPTVESKTRCWSLFTGHGGEHSDDFLKAGLFAFNQTHQEELLLPWVDRFFETVPEIRARRDAVYVRAFFTGLFPFYCVTPEVLERAESFAAAADDPQIKRMALESADELRRALLCQAYEG